MKISKDLAYDLLASIEGCTTRIDPNIVCMRINNCYMPCEPYYGTRSVIFLEMDTNTYYKLEDKYDVVLEQHEHHRWEDTIECDEVIPYQFTETRYMLKRKISADRS